MLRAGRPSEVDFTVDELSPGHGGAVGDDLGIAGELAIDDGPRAGAGAIGVEVEDPTFPNDAAGFTPFAVGILVDGGHDFTDLMGCEGNGRHEYPSAPVRGDLFGE